MESKLARYSSSEDGPVIYKTSTDIVCNTYEVHMSSGIEDTETYSDLIHLLNYATERDRFVFQVQNFGGSCHACISLANSMLQTQALTHVNLMGPSYSAGSTIALCADTLYMHPHSLLMFHDFSTVKAGKSSSIEFDIEKSKQWIHGYMADLHTPFLTKAECRKINSGQDLYIYATDPKTDDRIKRHFGENNKSHELVIKIGI